jgi:hypothetical protein
MFGIPFTIRRWSDAGVEDRTVYLRTRRCGEAGEAMRTALRKYRKLVFEQARVANKAGMMAAQAMTPSGDLDQDGRLAKLEKLAADSDAAMESAGALQAEALELAQKIAGMALQENYGSASSEIIDGLTDTELHAIVGSLELGQMPKDFFQSLDTQPKPNTTGRSGDSAVNISLAPGSPGGMSSKES